MAQPTCVKCGKTSFTGTMVNVQTAGRDVVLVHCSACGAVAGAVEQPSFVNLMLQIAKKIGV